MKKEFFSTTEVAKMLGFSRITIFNKIKAGEIKAKRVGRSFVIAKDDLSEILGTSLTAAKKQNIEEVVKKTVQEYGETLKLLGKE